MLGWFFLLLIGVELLILILLYAAISSSSFYPKVKIKLIKKIVMWFAKRSEYLKDKKEEAKCLNIIFLFVSVIILALSFVPSILNFREILVGEGAINPVKSNSPILFNLIITIIPLTFSVCFALSKKILLTPFQKSYEQINSRYFSGMESGYETTKVYISETLNNLDNIVEYINLELSSKYIEDNGWDEGPRKEKLNTFLLIGREIQKKFMHLDKYKDYKKAVFKDIFLDIYERTSSEFLEKIRTLVDNTSTLTPEFAANLIIEKASKHEGIKGQYATSLLDFDKFYDFYKHVDIAKISSSRETQRIFIADINAIWDEFQQDVTKIQSVQYDDLPNGLDNIFSMQIKIPRLFWVLEWHYKNYWELFYVDRQNAEEIFRTDGPRLPNLDFMVIDMYSYDLIFSADVLNPKNKTFYNLDINYYELLVRQEESLSRISFNFYNKLKAKGFGMCQAIKNILNNKEADQKFSLNGVDGNTVTLSNIIDKFEQRTKDATWVKT